MAFFKSLQTLATFEYGVAIIWYSFGYFFAFMGLSLLLSFILTKKKTQHNKKFFYLCDIMSFLNILVGCGILLSSRYAEVYVLLVFRYLFERGEDSFSDTLTLVFMAMVAIFLCLLYLVVVSQYFLRRERIYLNKYLLYSYVLLYVIVGILIFSQVSISEIGIKIAETHKILGNNEMLNSVRAKLNFMVYTTQLSTLIYFPTLLGNYIKGSVRGGLNNTRYIHVFSYILFISVCSILSTFICRTQL